LLGAVIATFTVTPVLSSILCRRMSGKWKPLWSVVSAHLPGRAGGRSPQISPLGGDCGVISVLCLSLGLRLGTEFLPKLEEGNLWIRAVMPPTITLEAGWIRWQRSTVILSYPPARTVFPSKDAANEGTDPTVRFSPSSLSRSSRSTSCQKD